MEYVKNKPRLCHRDGTLGNHNTTTVGQSASIHINNMYGGTYMTYGKQTTAYNSLHAEATDFDHTGVPTLGNSTIMNPDNELGNTNKKNKMAMRLYRHGNRYGYGY
jgi:hypothetical protein